MKFEFSLVVFLSLFVAAVTAGCGDEKKSDAGVSATPASEARQAPFPEPGPGRLLTEGVRVHEVNVPVEGINCRLWIYLPDPAPEKPLSCVLIAPAGTPMFHGIGLADGDRDEHVPYVHAGMAVVAYELNGQVEEDASNLEFVEAAMQFKAADGGLKNAAMAIDYIAEKVPRIDSSRLYAAGHSSAGTVSLLVGQFEPRIAGCIAYAPGLDVEAHLGDEFINALSRSAPDYRKFIQRISPANHPDRLTCPTFLFHSSEDRVAPIEETSAFGKKVRTHNENVKFVRAKTGDHYSSMIENGIPAAIEWLKTL